jgi:hypothetical protein
MSEFLILKTSNCYILKTRRQRKWRSKLNLQYYVYTFKGVSGFKESLLDYSMVGVNRVRYPIYE